MGHAVTGLSQPNYKLEYNNTLIPDELLMNKKLLLTLGVASAIAASYAAKKDPVVMRIAGRDVLARNLNTCTTRTPTSNSNRKA